MFNSEPFEALVKKTQESSLAASTEQSPFVSAAKKASAAFSQVKSKLSFSSSEVDPSVSSSQRSSRSKNILQDDPAWKEASTPAERLTVAVNYIVKFFGPIIDQINNNKSKRK